MAAPKSLIINSPYAAPVQHWQQARDGGLSLVSKRRDAGYEIFDVRNNTRRTEPLDRVNEIRRRVDAWRAADYPGITSVTRTLIEYWHDSMPGVVLAVDWNKVEPLALDPAQTPISAEIAPALGGATDWSKVHVIDLEKLPDEFRLQRITFKAARKAFETMEGRFTGTREYLVFQLIRLVEQFFDSKKLDIPSLFHREPLRKRILIALNIDIVVQHLLRFVVEQNQERIEPVFDEEFPIGSTRYMRTWYSTKPCLPARRSQISHVIADSSWEQYAANLFDSSGQKSVVAYVKNDHLGFQIYYLWNGSRKRFAPDFIIRLANGKTLVLEIKDEDSEQNRAKRSALDAWVQGVNAKGGFGVWCWDVAFKEAQTHDIIEKHAAQMR